MEPQRTAKKNNTHTLTATKADAHALARGHTAAAVYKAPLPGDAAYSAEGQCGGLGLDAGSLVELS